MTDRHIRHKRTAPFMSCGGDDICQIELVSTKYSLKARNNDRIRFHREAPEQNAGFVVDIDPPFSTGGSFSTNNPNLNIDIPSGQAAGDYKYTLSYPNDADAEVAPLDPIIIIEPPFLKRIFGILVASVISFIVGVSFAMNFL